METTFKKVENFVEEEEEPNEENVIAHGMAPHPTPSPPSFSEKQEGHHNKKQHHSTNKQPHHGQA